MHTSARGPLRDERGFTLIELLVVLLIIGILAAVAIPVFLSQTSKASDSNVESVLNTAHLTEASYRLSNGQYAQSTSLSTNAAAISALTAIENSLASSSSTYNLTLAQYPATSSGSSTSGYTISATSPKDGVTYFLQYAATGTSAGTVTKTCTAPNTGACNASGSW